MSLLHSISHQSTVKKKIQVKYFIGSEICTPAIFETEKGHGKDTKKNSLALNGLSESTAPTETVKVRLRL